MSSKWSMDDYVDVAERIDQFYERFPDGSLKSGQPPQIVEANGKQFVVYHAQAFRTPDDPRPADGWAWEPVPGPTQFTKDSELMNAETAAWGRAIVACGFKTKKVASRQEVRNRQGNDNATPERDDRLAAVIARLKALDPVTQWAVVLNDDAKKTYKTPGGLVALDQGQRDHLAARLEEHAARLEAVSSGGDTAPTVAGTPSSAPSSDAGAPGSLPEPPSVGEKPSAGTDGSSDDGKLSGSVDDAPAEPLFQPPTGPRGSKRKEAA